MQAYIKIKLLTGMRQQDLLCLKIADLRPEGIYVKPIKTENSTQVSRIIEWSQELRGAVEDAKSARKVDITQYLFCNRFGESHYNRQERTASGWRSMWKRFINRALRETNLTESFTEHDLRAKCASDAETLEHAKELLAHADSKLTERIYRRKTTKVKPLR